MNLNLRRARFGSRRGFTLLEIVVVLTIMAFLAAMVLPSIGLINNAEKAKITQQRLEMVRTAILGPRPLFDDQGKPIIGGFVGDMGRLPMLYESVDGGFGVDKRWYYSAPYLSLTNDGSDNEDFVTPDQERTEFLNEGQPRELWTLHPRGLDPITSPEDDNYTALKAVYATSWHGQYMYAPTDPVAQDHRFLAESNLVYDNLIDEDREAFRRVQCEGKVSDGWGRAISFFIDIYDDAGTEKQDLYMISAGPDGQIFISDVAAGGYEEGIHDYELRLSDLRTDPSPDPNDDYIVNLDNVMLKIAYDDWFYVSTGGGQSGETQEDLQAYATALDTYIKDTGLAADLYYWNGSGWTVGNNINPAGATDHPQPRVLWTQTPNDTAGSMIASFNLGVGWRGQYIGTPAGSTVEEQLLKDTWGRALHFYYTGGDSRTGSLIISSAGPNGIYGDTDDISISMISVNSKMCSASNVIFNFIVNGARRETGGGTKYTTHMQMLPSLNLSAPSEYPDSATEFYNLNTNDPVFTNPQNWTVTGVLSTDTTTPAVVNCAPGTRWIMFWHDRNNSGTVGVWESIEVRRIVQVEVDTTGMTPTSFEITMPDPP